MFRPLALSAIVLCALVACEGSAHRTDSSSPAVGALREATPVHVDSAIPMEEALRRFRAGIVEVPVTLREGAETRDALVERFARALEIRDTATIDRLILKRSEFAYLYYPTARLAKPPYELDPQMLWYQMIMGSETGIGRALQRYGGRSLGYVGYDCPHQAEREGANTIWSECAIRRVRAPGDTVREVLFGSILERHGRFKFVSYANGL